MTEIEELHYFVDSYQFLQLVHFAFELCHFWFFVLSRSFVV